MYVYPIYSIFFDESDEHVVDRGPSIGEILAICLTWRGLKHKFRKLDWRKEIIDHLIFIDERGIYESTDVEIEELENTLEQKDVTPAIEARVSYSVRNKKSGDIVSKRKGRILIAPILDSKI